MKAMTLAGLAGIAIFMGPAFAQQRFTGTGQFCIKGPTGPIKCDYQTNEQCQEARPQNENDRCISRSQVDGTVGSSNSSDQREQAPAPGEQKD